MGLKNFTSKLEVQNKTYNIAFCIMLAKNEHRNINWFNCALEKVQQQLRDKVQDGEQIKKAFVYRDGTLQALSFEQAVMEKTYYVEYVENCNPVSHTVLRSLMALEEAAEEQKKPLNILYMFLDKPLDGRNNNLIMTIMKNFEHMNLIPILVKDSSDYRLSMEDYIRERNGYVYTVDELINEDTIPYL